MLSNTKKKKVSAVITKQDRVEYYTLAYRYRSDALNAYSERLKKGNSNKGIRYLNVLSDMRNIDTFIKKIIQKKLSTK